MTDNPVRETLEAITRGAGALLSPLSRAQRRQWGATDEEASRPLPGDDLLPEARWSSTHAINIYAPPEIVWAWVVQIGYARGGLYSYESIGKAIFGGNTASADEILADFQDPRPGDTIRMHPSPTLPTFTVMAVDAPKDFLLCQPVTHDPVQNITTGVTWLFHLDPLPYNATRLLVRWRAYYAPDSLTNRISYGPLFGEQLTFVMETKMLEGIKKRAEAMAEPDVPIEPKSYELTEWP